MRIDISGTICSNTDKFAYDYFGIEATCPYDVQTRLEKTPKGERIDVYINSGGGDLFAGNQIYALLKEAKSVRIHVTGYAASAASVILCAAKSDIEPSAMVMIHNVWAVAQGDYHAMDHESNVLQKANEAVAAAYVDKTGKDKDYILDLMDEETWLTAEEAVEMGLVDNIRARPAAKLAAACCQMLTQAELDAARQTLQGHYKEKEQAKLNLIKTKMEV